LHCFNASPILLELSSKFYYGIGGILTFKNGKKLVEILPKIPLDRLVLETDAPYLTPEPHRGKRNEPAFTTYVADKMADILGLSRSDVESITTQNANRLFGI
jgi:TatD DNase family protein